METEDKSAASVAPPSGAVPNPTPAKSPGVLGRALVLLRDQWPTVLTVTLLAQLLTGAIWILVASASGRPPLPEDDQVWPLPVLAVATFAIVCALLAPIVSATREARRTTLSEVIATARQSLVAAMPLFGAAAFVIVTPFALWGWADLVAWNDVANGSDDGWWIVSYGLAFLLSVGFLIWAAGRLLVVAGLTAAGRDPNINPLVEARALVTGSRPKGNRVWMCGQVLAIAAIETALVFVWGPLNGALWSISGDGLVVDLLLWLTAAPLLIWPAVASAALADALRVRTGTPQPQTGPPVGKVGVIALLFAGVGLIAHIALLDWTIDKQPLRRLEADPMAAYSPAAATSARRGEHQDMVIHNLTLGLGDEPADLDAYTSQHVEFPMTTTADQLSAEVNAASAAAQQAGWTFEGEADPPYPSGEPDSLGYWSGTKRIDGMPATIRITAGPAGREFYERNVLQYGQSPSVDIYIEAPAAS